jgi:hypothetical protein
MFVVKSIFGASGSPARKRWCLVIHFQNLLQVVFVRVLVSERRTNSRHQNNMVSMRTSRSRSSPGHSPENVQTESKVAQRLAEAVDEAEPRKNRSGDLIMLTADFETLRSNLRVLVKAVKRYGDLSAQMASSRDEASGDCSDP